MDSPDGPDAILSVSSQASSPYVLHVLVVSALRFLGLNLFETINNPFQLTNDTRPTIN